MRDRFLRDLYRLMDSPLGAVLGAMVYGLWAFYVNRHAGLPHAALIGFTHWMMSVAITMGCVALMRTLFWLPSRPRHGALLSIAGSMVKAMNYRFDPAAETAMSDYIARRLTQPNFANARSVRNALDRARLRQANRLFAGVGDGALNVSADDLSTLSTTAQLKALVEAYNTAKVLLQAGDLLPVLVPMAGATRGHTGGLQALEAPVQALAQCARTHLGEDLQIWPVAYDESRDTPAQRVPEAWWHKVLDSALVVTTAAWADGIFRPDGVDHQPDDRRC